MRVFPDNDQITIQIDSAQERKNESSWEFDPIV